MNWTVSSQSQACAVNSAQPSARSRSSDRAGPRPASGKAQEGQRERADRVAPGVGRDHRGRAGDGDHDPGQGGPRDLGGGLGDAEQRVRVAELVARRELHGQAGQGGLEERVAGADHERGDDEQPDMRVPDEQRDREGALGGAPGHVGGQHHRPAAEPVGEQAAAEHERDHRDEVRGEHDAERGRRPAAVQHGEGDRDGRHRGAEQRGRIADVETPEVTPGQQPELALKAFLRLSSAI